MPESPSTGENGPVGTSAVIAGSAIWLMWASNAVYFSGRVPRAKVQPFVDFLSCELQPIGGAVLDEAVALREHAAEEFARTAEVAE